MPYRDYEFFVLVLIAEKKNIANIRTSCPGEYDFRAKKKNTYKVKTPIVIWKFKNSNKPVSRFYHIKFFFS